MTRKSTINLLCFTLGIIAGYHFKIDVTLIFRIFIISALFGIVYLFLNKNYFTKYLFPIVIFVFAFCYMDQYFLKTLPRDHLSNLPKNKTLTIQGYLYMPPEVFRYKTYLYLNTDGAIIENLSQKVSGCVRISLRITEEIAKSDLNLHYGDYISIEVKLYEPNNFKNPGGIDYKLYLERQGIYVIASCKDSNSIKLLDKDRGYKILKVLYGMREKILDVCEADMDRDSYQIFAAMVFGDRTKLDYSTQERFRDLGITHLISVSGLHVGFVAFIFYSIVKEILLRIRYTVRFKSTGRICSIITIFPVIAYSIISGLRIPTIRAMIMILIFLICKIFYVRINSFRTLAFSWIVIMLIDPLSIIDPGCQLSFLAVASIIYSNHLVIMRKWIEKFKFIPASMIFYISSVIIVYIVTIPIVLYNFKKISAIGILGNFFLIPLFGVIISLGILNGVLIILRIPLFHIINKILSLGIYMLFSVMDYAASFRFCQLTILLNTVAPIILFYLLLFCILHLKRKRLLPISILTVLLVISMLFNYRIFKGDTLHATFLDMGDGISTHIAFPNGVNYLIDCGTYSYLPVGYFIMDPYFHNQCVSTLDKIFISHLHTDHYRGMEYIVSNYSVKNVILGSLDYMSDNLMILWFEIAQRYIPMTINDYGDNDVEKFASVNDRSYIFKLVFGKVSFLFCGDADAQALYSLLRYGKQLKSDVLLLPHEGSKNSCPQEFLDAVSPDVVIISASAYNRFGHPSEEVLARLKSLKSKPKIYITKDSGAVIVSTDGEDYDIKTWLTRWE
jgi:competence protein ComEC